MPIDAICEIWRESVSWLQRRCRLKMLTMDNDRRTCGQRMPAYTISSPMSLWLRWAKNHDKKWKSAPEKWTCPISMKNCSPLGKKRVNFSDRQVCANPGQILLETIWSMSQLPRPVCPITVMNLAARVDKLVSERTERWSPLSCHAKAWATKTASCIKHYHLSQSRTIPTKWLVHTHSEDCGTDKVGIWW